MTMFFVFVCSGIVLPALQRRARRVRTGTSAVGVPPTSRRARQPGTGVRRERRTVPRRRRTAAAARGTTARPRGQCHTLLPRAPGPAPARLEATVPPPQPPLRARRACRGPSARAAARRRALAQQLGIFAPPVLPPPRPARAPRGTMVYRAAPVATVVTAAQPAAVALPGTTAVRHRPPQPAAASRALPAIFALGVPHNLVRVRSCSFFFCSTCHVSCHRRL